MFFRRQVHLQSLFDWHPFGNTVSILLAIYKLHTDETTRNHFKSSLSFWQSDTAQCAHMSGCLMPEA